MLSTLDEKATRAEVVKAVDKMAQQVVDDAQTKYGIPLSETQNNISKLQGELKIKAPVDLVSR